VIDSRLSNRSPALAVAPKVSACLGEEVGGSTLILMRQSALLWNFQCATPPALIGRETLSIRPVEQPVCHQIIS
jgi:hypothetical protein